MGVMTALTISITTSGRHTTIPSRRRWTTTLGVAIAVAIFIHNTDAPEGIAVDPDLLHTGDPQEGFPAVAALGPLEPVYGAVRWHGC